ncbi:MAG: HINT domain-containing protein, partial [Planctomycetaceae bacterium]|nr:HINT domain-containing protein [Planctomycetaceae bacterium]
HHENIASSEKGYYVEAKDLKVGDTFLGANNELSTLAFTERLEFPEGITVYNFTVADNHNYFVIANVEAYQNGASVVLVHNANGSYTINFNNNNMKYHGKGDNFRAETSAKRIEDTYKVKRTNIEWTDASSTKQSFIDEANRIRTDKGGVKSPYNYNKINSPGEKYLRIEKADE